MKKIIYTRQDGGVSVVTPSEGSRLAFWVKLADGTFVHDGFFKTILDIWRKQALPVDRFMRGWPIAGAVAEWAETEEEWLARIQLKSVPADATGVRTVDSSDIPQDRAYRNAWIDTGSSVTHDMTKARELHKDKLRAWRAPKLAALDVDYQRADEQGDSRLKSQVAIKKQALRDVTKDPRIEAASTIAELKLVVPPVLLK